MLYGHIATPLGRQVCTALDSQQHLNLRARNPKNAARNVRIGRASGSTDVAKWPASAKLTLTTPKPTAATGFAAA